ncbi:oxidoreductase [Chryseobacterium sp. 6424]|uniref:Gfo/Idh/MocA family oxidoreductase n=1 Tax=Chryseobacterium sp. 6424 TaxID=2039166 RepID=UPI000EFD471E|nr:Gfo/Idh/MocA family oxidoreductase [Chryseobacterium sp. 6424]AYO58222.1 oxidoreductase [Chryseobacterium sp. 6424]
MQEIKAGLCAYGMSGKLFHAPFLNAHPGFSLNAVVERHKHEAADKYPDIRHFRSVEDMIHDPEVDLVIVNTPVQTHAEFAEMALQAGKHVIVEKPFTVNAQQAEDLVELAAKKKLFLSVYQNRRFDRDYLQVKKMIDSGKLGKIREAEIRFDRFRTQPSHKQHKEDPQLPGSGALHDLGSHLIDQAIQLFGMPTRVFGDTFSMKGAAFANDYFEIILFYADGLRVRIISSAFAKEAAWAYAVHGDQGSFLQQRSDHQEAELAAGAVPTGKDWQQPLTETDGLLHYSTSDTYRTALYSIPGNYMDYYQAIYHHLIFDEAAPSPGHEIINNMKIIDAVLRSSASGMVITL